MLVKERLEKQVQGCLFVEEVSNSYAGFKVTVITKDSIEWIKKELSDEYKLVQNFGTYLLGSNSVDTLIHHWAKGRIYQRNKGMSVSKKTYPVRDAINLLKSYNQSHINHPKDCLKLIEFAMSLVEKKTKVITFGMDTDSLEFLFDDSKKPSKKNLVTDMSSNAVSKMLQLTIDAFYELGIKFQKVQINSGYRTHEKQAGIMMKLSNLDAYGITQYFVKYLKLIKAGDEAIYTAYYEENKGTDKGHFSNKIKADIPTLVSDVKTNGVEQVLINYMKIQEYAPSKHPYHIAYDIDINTSTTYMFNKIKRRGTIAPITTYFLSKNLF